MTGNVEPQSCCVTHIELRHAQLMPELIGHTRVPQLYVGGRWEKRSEGERREIRCPADGHLVAEIDEAGPQDTAAAIAAAREAFDDGAWPPAPRSSAARLLHRVADLLERDKEVVARAESLDTGKRLVESEYDVDDVVGVFRHYGNVAARGGRPAWSTPVVPTWSAGSCTSRSASAALITPWNYPLLQTSWKVAPASPRATRSCSSPASSPRTPRSC